MYGNISVNTENLSRISSFYKKNQNQQNTVFEEKT